jgi:hypothetical protein
MWGPPEQAGQRPNRRGYDAAEEIGEEARRIASLAAEDRDAFHQPRRHPDRYQPHQRYLGRHLTLRERRIDLYQREFGECR